MAPASPFQTPDLCLLKQPPTVVNLSFLSQSKQSTLMIAVPHGWPLGDLSMSQLFGCAVHEEKVLIPDTRDYPLLPSPGMNGEFLQQALGF